VLELVGRGDIQQSSFTFMDVEDDWTYSGGVTHRTLLSGGILDVAPVSAVPAYEDTTVGLRSLAAHKDVPDEDVFALARQHELRKLFIRTDQALTSAPEAEERAVTTEATPDPAEPVEPAPEPAPEPEQPAPEPEPGMSRYDADLRLWELRMRFGDPIATPLIST